MGLLCARCTSYEHVARIFNDTRYIVRLSTVNIRRKGPINHLILYLICVCFFLSAADFSYNFRRAALSYKCKTSMSSVCYTWTITNTLKLLT